MVPAPVSTASGISRLASRALQRRERLVHVAALGVALLLTSVPLAAQDAEIVWQRAFLVGSASRETAFTRAVEVRSTSPVDIHLVLEGERGGLPVYCTAHPDFRIEGRAIPERMTISPEAAGLAAAELHWTMLRPNEDATDWKRTRLPAHDGRWTMQVLDLPRPEGGTALRGSGTARYAAAAAVPRADRTATIGTSGWEREPHWSNPDNAPGFRVSRYQDDTIAGRARAFVGLPVVSNATVGHVREKIAVRSVDVVLGALVDLSGRELPASRDAELTDPIWSWMFETIYSSAHRRELAGLRVVSSESRGIPWADMKRPDAPGIRRSDVLVVDGRYAVADADDGDGWLGNGDNVLHGTGPIVDRTRLVKVPGRDLTILRPRNFRDLRRRLENAGYGPLGQKVEFDAPLELACREFQRDRQLPETGIPDADTLAALDVFLARIESVDP